MTYNPVAMALLAGCLGALLPAAACAAEPPRRDLLPIDASFEVANRVAAHGVTAALAERDGRLSLQLGFAPGENRYPGATIGAPGGGAWNLQDCNRVVFRVANVGAAPVHLGCRVSDGPVSDGHKHCNTEMVNLGPGESKTVTVIFGRSYGGNPGWKLDRARVTSIGLHADQPKGATTVAILSVEAQGGDLPGQVRLAPDATWQPIEHHLVPEKGSALDFSFLLEAPAGRHGAVVIRNGRMEFRDKPGAPARFYGANVVYGANFPDRETAVIMADQLAANGYNSLRFHHFDQLILDRRAADSVTFDPAQLDRLDYFFACLKERGIYLTIDLYATRETKAEEIPELGVKAVMGKYKSAVYILDSARRNWEEFSRRLLTHVNPYTGLAWKDDPALFALSLINEGQVYQSWHDNARLYRERFEAAHPEAAAQSPEQRAATWNRFLTEIQRNWTRQATAFVRGLGTEVLITDANYIPMRPLSIFRTDLEVVDIHCYYDGPNPLSGWGAPLRCGHGNLVKDGGVHMPLYSVAGRLMGKPFMITEFNMGYPSRQRSACGPMVGAFSGFQAIDAVYRFDHIGVPLSQPGPIVWLSSANDPVALLSDRIGAALFLRQEVNPATTEVPYLVTDAYLNKTNALDWTHWYHDTYIAVGMHHRIGSVVLQGDGKLERPATVLVSTESVPPERIGNATLVPLASVDKVGALMKQAHPDTPPPQIRIDRGAGTLRITTPRSECLFVPDRTPRLEGDLLKVEAAEGAATIAALALDGLPLAESRRVLVVHLTDVANLGDLYQDASMRVLEKYGSGGLLVRKGSSRVTVRGNWEGARLHVLDLAGRRRAEAALEHVGGGVSFEVRTHRDPINSLAYELVR